MEVAIEETVTQVRFDAALTLLVHGGWELRIEGAFTLERDGAPALHVGLDARPTDAAPAVELLDRHVERFAIGDDGRLDVHFADGTVLRASPGDHHEAWTLNGPARLCIVSGPGGRLTTWGPDR